MRDSFLRTFIIGCILILSPNARADVRAGYKAPLFTIPFTSTPPKIDGIVDDAEWQNALSINALQTTEGKISSRQTQVWMCWDADHLYLAMRSPLRPGERVMQAFRQTGRDNSKVVFDDSYEIWLNADTQSPDGEKVFFQYLGNFAGAKFDVMFEPLVGNSRPGWESGWKPISRITPDGKFWEMEVAIPRQSIYRNEPFEDGETLHGLFVRNFKRPWEQNSLGGSGSFSVPETHCTFVLSKSAPAIHLLGVADAESKTFGVNLESTDPTLKWSFESDSGVKADGDTLHAVNNLNLDKSGDGSFRIRITSADQSKTYLDWSSHRSFGDLSATTQPLETVETPKLTLTFNPVKNYVRVDGDFIDDDNRNSIARYQAEVLDASGKPLAQQELHLDDLAYVHGLLNLGECAPGNYTARLTGFDSAGKQVFQKESAFTKKDPAKEFPWWNTTAGNIEKVIAPWTPMQHHDDTIDMWGRSMQIGDAGLPKQITTQNAPMLAAPISLVADEISATSTDLKTESDSDHRVTINANSSLGNLQIASKITTEFDGLYKVRMTISPKQPTSVKSLKIVIPLKPEFAQYFHACGEGIRYGFSYGYLPPNKTTDKTGQLWSSKQVDGQPMLVGSFIPYVWIGNDIGGIGWMADSDEGWSPSDKIPAIEIRRDSPEHVDLVLNLIGEPATIDKPRTITFAFQATPVKPLRDGWRMDTWSTADSFKDWCQVEPRGGHLIWNALPFTLDPAACKKMVDERHQQTDEYNFGITTKYHPNAVPYFENNGIDKHFAPAVEYFGDQWHASVSDSLCYDKTLSDFIVWNLGQWCEQTGIDGWYVDNVRPVACDNIDAGRGYRLPDGRIQPTYQMFATREFFLRVRAVFAEHNKSGKFVLHMTNHMIMPWLGAADLALDGEDHVTFPEMGKDFIDFWSPERMRLDYPKPIGVAVTFLEEYQGNWNHDDLKRVTRAYTAMSILNDVMPGANPNGYNQEVWRGRDRFGIESPEATFVPYWDKQSAIHCNGAEMLASYWKKPGSVLIAVVNRGEASTASLSIDHDKLGLPALEQCEVLDADDGESAMHWISDGSLHVPIPRHDYRQILISKQKE